MHWSGDGNIFAEDVARTQLVFIKADEVNNILRGVSAGIGMDIGGIVARSETHLGRRLSKAYYAEYLSHIPGGRLTKPSFLMKGFYERIFKVFSILGFGTLSMVEYHPRKSVVIRARKPHNRDLVAGLCRGFFEQTEGTGFEISYDPADAELVRYTAAKERDYDEDKERFRYEERDAIPGNVQHRTCGTCGVPVRISQTFYWDAGEGLVGNQRHHMREVVFPVDGINALIRGLTPGAGGGDQPDHRGHPEGIQAGHLHPAGHPGTQELPGPAAPADGQGAGQLHGGRPGGRYLAGHGGEPLQRAPAGGKGGRILRGHGGPPGGGGMGSGQPAHSEDNRQPRLTAPS